MPQAQFQQQVVTALQQVATVLARIQELEQHKRPPFVKLNKRLPDPAPKLPL